MQSLSRLIKQEIKFPALAGAALVLAPLILAACITGQPIWLRAGLIAISTFIGMERAGLAPLGVLLHGLAIIAGFMALLCALILPAFFVFGCAIMAAQAFLNAMAPLPYPTAIRGIGVGAAVAAGRIGSIVGPKLGGVLRAAGHDSSQLLLDLLPIIVLASACALWLAWNSRNEGSAADA